MLRIRVKMGPARNKEWTCFFGLHVRTATITIGMWHLFLNIMALIVLGLIMQDPQMLHELESGYDDSFLEQEPPALPTPLSKIEPPYAYRDHSLNYHNVDMGGLVYICMIAITLIMIYGAVKGKPSHLLPFFCLQLFDFAVTTLTAAGYLCYLRSVHRVIDKSHRLPWREELLKLSPQTLSIVVLLAFVAVVLLKAYAIGIVWRCYKYLTIRQHNLRTMLPYIIPDVSTRQERDYSTLLPDYDEAIAQNLKQAPPPSYQVAMSSPINSPNATEVITTPDAAATNETNMPSSPPPYSIVTDTATTSEGAAAATTVATEINTGNNDSDQPQASNSANAINNGNNPSAKVI